MAQTCSLTGIVAMTSSRLIGKDGTLPWHLPEDLKFFKKTTLGHPVIMGRKTFDSIGKPLPKRANIVMTRNSSWQRPGVSVIQDPSDLSEVLPEDCEKAFVIGGAEIYRVFLPHLTSLIVSEVHAQYEGDTYFPAFLKYFPRKHTLRVENEFSIQEYRSV